MRSLFSNAVIAVASVVTASGLVAFADPANADVPSAPQVVVQISDLNLASAEGRATAERRIHGAAAQVCGNDGDAMGASAQCRIHAVDDADATLDARIAAL